MDGAEEVGADPVLKTFDARGIKRRIVAMDAIAVIRRSSDL